MVGNRGRLLYCWTVNNRVYANLPAMLVSRWLHGSPQPVDPGLVPSGVWLSHGWVGVILSCWIKCKGCLNCNLP